MKLTKACVLLVLPMAGLSACSTVDLSQVAVTQSREKIVQPKKTVVERATTRLTRNFQEKGWCEVVEQDKTAKFASLLLKGIKTTPEARQATPLQRVSIRQLRRDIHLASIQIRQTTKAADVFLNLNGGAEELDPELGRLETALTSARQAESHFIGLQSPEVAKVLMPDMDKLHQAIINLQKITDSYGEQIRQSLAARRNGAKS